MNEDSNGSDDYGWGEDLADLVAEDGRMELAPDGIVIHLLKPIPGDDGDTATITLAEPTAGLLEKLDKIKGEMAQTNFIVQNCANILPLSQKHMGMRDLIRVGNILAVFTGDRQKTGDE